MRLFYIANGRRHATNARHRVLFFFQVSEKEIRNIGAYAILDP